MTGSMTAFDHFQNATVMIAEGRMIAARQEVREALAWIDRTGKERHMRDDVAALLEAVEARAGG